MKGHPTQWVCGVSPSRYLSTVRNAIPFSLLYNTTPDYSHLWVFGCLCYPNMTATTRHKLAPRSTACVFLGYPSSHKGYRCLNMSTKRIVISCHVVFDETCFPFGLYSPRMPSSDLDFLLAGSAAPVHCTAAAAPTAVAPPSLGVEQPRPSRAHLEELPDDPILMRGPVIIPPARRPAQAAAPASSPSAAAPTVVMDKSLCWMDKA